MDFWYSVTKGIVWAYQTFLFAGYDVQGRENIQSGAKIVVANHPNATDPFFLPFIFPEKLHFFAEESLFRLPFFGMVLRKADQIPVIPGHGKEIIGEACERLAQGQTVVIFPEGHLSHGKSFQQAKSGAAVLALESGAPLVPAGFYVPEKYTRKIQQKKGTNVKEGRWQMGGTCFIQIGKPWNINLSDYQDCDSSTLADISDGIMTRIQSLMVEAEKRSKPRF
jgi:1-acyl-sn-glycerol-3-phosphate acyltransferase